MAKLKNLANCKPSEFLRQTNRIRKSVSKWLTLTDILNIRERQPKLSDDMPPEDVKKAIQQQSMDNLNDILDAALDKHPDETLELLALASFVEPEDVDKHTVGEYLASFNELLTNEDVTTFFTSLVDLGLTFGSEE